MNQHTTMGNNTGSDTISPLDPSLTPLINREDRVYDVIVVGAGHAGCEAALAAARLGCDTLLLTGNLDTPALMPCNPSIGGPAKGHLVREIDALGGAMAEVTDATHLQIRELNTGKGPAVRALRAQVDKKLYQNAMKWRLEQQPRLRVRQAMVERVLIEPAATGPGGEPRRRVAGVVSQTGREYQGRAIVLTTGTFLRGRIVVGKSTHPAGRAGEAPSIGLGESLATLGLQLRRLKTGTPPRIDARAIDFDETELVPGSPEPLYFSWAAANSGRPPHLPEPNLLYPDPRPTGWRQQLPCYLVRTVPATHDLIRANLHRAPLYSGLIEGIGPRYCPSIEDKIVRFSHKESHQLFLEPEGWQTNEVYVQGANTSLPEEVQLAMLRTIPGLRHVELMRVGYAVEYDYVLPHQVHATLEVRAIAGLFLAGQINGTSGYEEAGAQGLLAGANAALRVQGRPPLVLRRDQAYIGVLIDDLVTKEISEPYRLLTARAEYRLLLRQESADLRLAPLAAELGLITPKRLAAVEEKAARIEETYRRLESVTFRPTHALEARAETLGLGALGHHLSAVELLRRPEATYAQVRDLAAATETPLPDAHGDVALEVECRAKYATFIRQQTQQVERARRLEGLVIPPDFDYQVITALRTEAREKLSRFRPHTLGQAARIVGVSPADVAVLMVWLERAKRRKDVG